ncbi:MULTISPECIES: ABC transporter substrate-binding protein [Prauserella salsuginis group]|uniref:ABC transporter substrate-binding protein n=1 Tax=Prauserella salsuginis TaxID=387889 RepID=A0ABW6G191_9PSEU|nr:MULTISPECIES: ABC transporter substrate-binding protein [Prauserella salsuginis group]MCR3722121.1 amino acid/amide ABC transporter substrate-binding protein, HAAT family (TC 3.A.1.4.-) [Prauserella flava]MCR3736118.1 amino acid/amide ABC transporter substrate-binding protein, HAAT family (TC 3.A.1.4.-) [Prauserella salsuginis]
MAPMRIRPGATVTAAACAGALLATSACGGGAGSGSDTIVIGYSGPLSGGAAVYGKNIQDGLQLAIDDLNERGVTVDGEEYRVELQSLDDQYAPDAAATNAQRLAEQDDAAVVFIPHAGGIQAAQELNSSRTEFLLGAYSSDPKIVEQGNELTMMIPPSFKSYAEPFVDKLTQNGESKLGLLGTSSEYGQEWTKLVTEEWKSRGGQVLSDNSIDYATVSDFAGPVSRTLADNPDVIFLGGPSQPTAVIIEEARRQGYEGSFLLMDQAKFEEMEEFTDPENLNNAIGVKPVRDYDDPGTDDLLDAYAEKVTKKQPVTSEVALNYQSAAIVVTAMQQAGSIDDSAAIREAIPDAIGEVDEHFHVSGFPTEITDAGHLRNKDLEAAYRTPEGEYEYLPIEQPDE